MHNLFLAVKYPIIWFDAAAAGGWQLKRTECFLGGSEWSNRKEEGN